ncbi:MAG: Hint domain-containing protein [Methylorubrum rhodinum]|uniref:Hint domain-containing protein n=1 Tax=Methylorubrum rhodinum TaxID=29428 RepID=UPI003BB1464B
MSGGPLPSQYFANVFGLYKKSGASFQVGFEFNLGSANVTDPSDEAGDTPTQLGDISSDGFATDEPFLGSGFTFIGTAQDGNGFVGKNSSGDYFLFTDRRYGDLSYFTVKDQAYALACFTSGTRLATAGGPVAVEDLAVGDRVVTASGAERPVRWIGHRALACRGRADWQPVRITAHAFGEGRPERDLLVSPGHALCVDVLGEVLVPAGRLVNGTTLARMELESVTYWHVELDDHDILLAEGLPAESYRDTGNRGFFAEDEGSGEADPAPGPDGWTQPRTGTEPCRPLHEAGVLVEVLRDRLTDRARSLGWRLAEAPLAGLHLVADGQIVRPDIDGLVARFVLSAEARQVRLVCDTSVPAHVVPGSTDERRLGVALAALTLDDGLTGLRTIALDDPRLGEGFHPPDGEGETRWRWTDGSALLPDALWEGCRGTLFLRVGLSCPALPRWIGPREAAGVVDLAEFRRPV